VTSETTAEFASLNFAETVVPKDFTTTTTQRKQMAVRIRPFTQLNFFPDPVFMS
jgi:hypothetical protein